MKLFPLAAVLIAGSLGATVAEAQPVRHTVVTTTTTRSRVVHHPRKVCRTSYVHHRRVTRCTTR